jgi:hypothetical protein
MCAHAHRARPACTGHTCDARTAPKLALAPAPSPTAHDEMRRVRGMRGVACTDVLVLAFADVAMVAEQQQHQLALHQHAAAAAAAAMADYGARVVGAGVDPSVAMAGIPGVMGVPGVVTGMGDVAGVPSLLGAQALAGGLPL